MSKASQSASNKLLFTQSLPYGGFNVTKDWKKTDIGSLSVEETGGHAGLDKTMYFNPANPSEYIILPTKANSQIEELDNFLKYRPVEGQTYQGGKEDYSSYKQDIQDFDLNDNEAKSIFGRTGSNPIDWDNINYSLATVEDKAQLDYLTEITNRVNSGEITADEANRLGNSYSYDPGKTTYQKAYDDTSSLVAKRAAEKAKLPPLTKSTAATSTTPGAGTGTGGLQMDYNRALADIYTQRPDLQELYGGDGRAINPNDPRVKDIPTIVDWAEKYGANEYSALGGYTRQAASAATNANAGTPGTGTGAGVGGFPSTGDTNLDSILGQLQQQITNAQANGQMINPNIELTPAEVKKFLDQATSEIDPYYSSQINAIRKDLDRSLDELESSYQLEKRQYEMDFKSNLANKREDLAGSGLAFSGVRGQEEKGLADATNLRLEAAGASAASKAAGAITDTEAKIGSRNLSSLSMPNLVEYQTDLTGEGALGTRKSLNFGGLGSVTGDLEYNRNRDIRQLSDYLQSQEVNRKTLNF